MLDVIVYLLDEDYKEEIESSFRSKDFLFHYADNPQKVVDICKQEFIDLILIWPATYENTANLLTILNKDYLCFLPIIAVVKDENEITQILHTPIVGVITIPIAKDEFYLLIEQHMKSVRGESTILQGRFWQGNLEEFDLIDLMHMVEMSNRDAMLTLNSRGHQGQIYFNRGKIIRANLRSLEGMEAISKLLGFTKASFQVHFTQVESAQSIEIDNRGIFQELQKIVSERDNLVKYLPEFETDLIVTQKSDGYDINEIKEQIFELCENGESINELLIVMNYDSIEILKNITEMLKNGQLTRRQDYESSASGKIEKKGLGQFINNLGSIFKKDKSKNLSEDLEMHESNTKDDLETELKYKKIKLDYDVVEKIEKFFKEF
jgi:hypothetical protein